MKLDTTKKIGLGLIFAYVVFGCLPGTLANWMYDYFLFLPIWGSVLCVLVATGCLFLPEITSTTKRTCLLVLFAISLWGAFIVFRTHVHCFGGDGCVGGIPSDLSLAWRSFIPEMPGKGRLDTYGLGIITVLGLRFGILQRVPGMTVAAGSQLFCYFWGAIYLIVAVLAFRKRIGYALTLLTLPFVFNFFGNVDSYPLPLTFALLFLIASNHVFSLERPGFWAVMGYGIFWLFSGWVHPLSGMIGFLPAIIGARWLNGVCRRKLIPDWVACVLYGVLFFVVIEFGYHKGIFSAPYAEVPPVFSAATLIFILNVCILPILPVVVFILLGPAPREAKRLNLVVFAAQIVCFCAAHFTQGVNDQFPYMLCFCWMALPCLVTLWRYPLGFAQMKVVVALNLLLLVPMLCVHSSDLTIDRACYLYPMDDCKHNKEMSWQTHLGLILGDCLESRPAVGKAVLKTFANGARSARPVGFRGGNQLYWIAFHYHYGDFTEGRRLLAEMLKRNPSAVRYFLSTRPGFIYMNRKTLWNDLYDLFPIEHEKPQLKAILDSLRKQAESERYCLIRPDYARDEY